MNTVRDLLDRIAEAERLARGWRLSLRIHARLRRQEEGRPILEILNDTSEINATD